MLYLAIGYEDMVTIRTFLVLRGIRVISLFNQQSRASKKKKALVISYIYVLQAVGQSR